MIISNNRKSNFVVVAVLLILIPTFFTVLACDYFISSQEDLFLKGKQNDLEIFTRNFLIKLDPESRHIKDFRRIARQLKELDKNSKHDLQTVIDNGIASIGQDITVFLFNSDGLIEFTNSKDQDGIDGFGYIWRSATNRQFDLDSFRIYKTAVVKYLGRYFHPRLLRLSNDVCHPFANYGKTGLVYHIKSSRDASGVLIYFENRESHETIVTNIARSFSGENAYVQVKSISKEPDQPENAETFYFRKSQTDTDVFVCRDFMIKDYIVSAGIKFEPYNFNAIRALGILVIFLIAVTAMTKLFSVMVLGRTWWISIRHKLVAIFIFAVYLPLLGLFILGITGISDRRTVLENNIRKGLQDAIFRIDSEFSKKEEEIKETFERLYKDKKWRTTLDPDWNKMDLIVREAAGVSLEGQNFFNHLDVRDLEQNMVYASARGETLDRIKNINRIISLICMEKFIPDQLPRRNLRPADLILKTLMENPVTGFTSLYEQPGQIVQMEFEGSSFYWYWNYYKEDNEQVAFFMGNTKTQFNVTEYLRKALTERFSLGNTAIRVIAFHPETQLWIPSKAAEEEEITDLIKLAKIRSSAETGTVILEESSYLAACIPGIKLKDSFVIALYPQSEIDSKISSLQRQLNTGALLIIFIAALTGLLLSKTLLKPVSELDLGLKALRKRDTEFRVEIENRDELGELGKTFNQMMDEVKEMLLAGAVQRCLIPSEAPEIPGYESVIFNKMATDVGGDYADFFTLPGNRYLVVLGDVTGHGISSSILTAMVKAQVFRFATYDADLVTILNNLSEMIYELMKYRKLMTFCAIILDANDHSFHIANAGHPYPIFCNSEGEIRLLSHSSLPLGVSLKRSKYEQKHEQFAPGSTIMIYTDGIAEAPDEFGREFGFATVEKIISDNINSNAAGISENLQKKFWEHYKRDELDDDLTYIIIKRKV